MKFDPLFSDMEGDDVEYSEASAGASATYPVQCSSLRKNGFVMIKGRPCKVMEMSTSKTGKHGHAKVSPLLNLFLNACLTPSYQNSGAFGRTRYIH